MAKGEKSLQNYIVMELHVNFIFKTLLGLVRISQIPPSQATPGSRPSQLTHVFWGSPEWKRFFTLAKKFFKSDERALLTYFGHLLMFKAPKTQ